MMELHRIWYAHDIGHGEFLHTLASAYPKARFAWGFYRHAHYPSMYLNYDFRWAGEKLWPYEALTEEPGTIRPSPAAQAMIEAASRLTDEARERLLAHYQKRTPKGPRYRLLTPNLIQTCTNYLDERLGLLQQIIALFKDACSKPGAPRSDVKRWIGNIEKERKAMERLRCMISSTVQKSAQFQKAMV